MPHVFSIDMAGEEPTDEMLDDENYDPYLAAPEAFQYLAAPDLGGPLGPVRVAVRPEQAGKIDNGPDAYERWSRRPRRAPDAWEIEAESAAAKIAAALYELGAVRAYLRYDGGNDEGFAWFDHCVMQDGAVRDADEIAKQLADAGVKPGVKMFEGRDAVRHALDDVVALMWSVALLGQGYGTGEYVMYGAFSVDLETGVATDDPAAQPIVRNITLKAT